MIDSLKNLWWRTRHLPAIKKRLAQAPIRPSATRAAATPGSWYNYLTDLWSPKQHEQPGYLGIQDQGRLGSCTGQGLTGGVEGPRNIGQRIAQQLAVLFSYFYGRAPSWRTKDAGTTMDDLMAGALDAGMVPDSAWPYVAANVNVEPPPEVRMLGQALRITGWVRLKQGFNDDDLMAIWRNVRQAQARGYVVLFAMVLENDFFKLGPDIAQHYAYTGMDKAGAVQVGGHCMYAPAFRNGGGSDEWICFDNSWSPNWGIQGRAFLRPMCAIKDAFDIIAVTEINGVDLAAAQQARHEVAQLYVALFGRAPEAEGLDFWTGLKQTQAQLAERMYGTAPARAYYPVGLTIEQTVGAFYRNVLGREADPDGLAYWAAVMAYSGIGGTIAEMIRTVETYRGSDPDGLRSQNYFNERCRLARVYAEGGGAVQGAAAAIAGVVY